MPDISLDKVIFTDFTDINTYPAFIKRSLKRLFSIGRNNDNQLDDFTEISTNLDENQENEESNISYYCRKLTNIPDRTIGWYPTPIRQVANCFAIGARIL